jgi:hypothetical protein
MKTFPFGFLHLLNAKKNKESYYLIGVHPEYQNKRVHAIIFKEYHTTFTERNRNCIRTELIDNVAIIHKLWKHFNPGDQLPQRLSEKNFEVMSKPF